MSRYDLPDEGLGEYEPGAEAGVLANRKGIKTAEEIDLVEAVLLQLCKTSSLAWIDDETQITASIIKRLHKAWLGSLYAWAGEYRTVNLAKGSYAAWCPAHNIESQMCEFEKDELARYTPCQGSDEEVVTAITLVHERFLSIHPFREGNGRLSRWIADLMAMQAGRLPLDWVESAQSEEGRQAYYAAVQSAHAGKMDRLSDLIRTALQRGQSLGPLADQG